jgi:hypothetical protein
MAKAEVKPVTPEWLAPFVEAEIGENEYRKRRRKKRAEGIEDALITSHIVDDSTRVIFDRLNADQREQLLAEAPEDYREYAARGDKQRTTVLLHEIEDKIRAALGLKLMRRPS